MKKTALVYLLLVFFVIAVLVWLNSSESQPKTGIVIKPKPLPTKTFHQAPSDYNRFAIESYSKIARAKGDQNAVFSPFSLSMALEVLYAGSAGNTATELQNVLHLTPQSNHEKPQNSALFEYKSPKRVVRFSSMSIIIGHKEIFGQHFISAARNRDGFCRRICRGPGCR